MFSGLDRVNLPPAWMRIVAFIVAPFVVAAGGFCLFMLGQSIWDFTKVGLDDKLAAVPRLILLPVWTIFSLFLLSLGISTFIMAKRKVARISVSPETPKEQKVTPVAVRIFNILFYSSLVITYPVSIVVSLFAFFFISEDWEDLITATPIVIGLTMFFGSLLWIGIYIAWGYSKVLRARRNGSNKNS